MRWVNTQINRVIGAMNYCAGLSIVLMMIHVTLEVIGRKLFDAPIPGTTTVVSNFYMVIAVFIPLALAEMRGSHISVEIFVEQLPGRTQYHLGNVLGVFVAVVCVFLTISTYQEAIKKYLIGASITQGSSNIPIWASYFLLPLGFGMMTVVMAFKFVAYVMNTRPDHLNGQQQDDDLAWRSETDK